MAATMIDAGVQPAASLLVRRLSSRFPGEVVEMKLPKFVASEWSKSLVDRALSEVGPVVAFCTEG